MMRRQAKPFTVEIKKSRKGGHEPSCFLGLVDLAEPAPAPRPAAEEAAKVFGRFAEAAAVFAPAPDKAVTRILPDLSRKPEPEAEPAAEAAAEPEPRLARVPKPRRKPVSPVAAEAEPVPIVFEAEPPARRLLVEPRRMPALAVAADDGEAEAPARRLRRAVRQPSRYDAEGLRAGERWKRRLPPVLR